MSEIERMRNERAESWRARQERESELGARDTGLQDRHGSVVWEVPYYDDGAEVPVSADPPVAPRLAEVLRLSLEGEPYFTGGASIREDRLADRES